MLPPDSVQQNKELHQKDQNFGNRADAAGVATDLPKALDRLHELGLCNSILDFGTGKGLLVHRLRDELGSKVNCSGYDPSVDEWSSSPAKADVVTCLDVLEHIELSDINEFIANLHSLTNNILFACIDHQLAVKTLSDRRNAHILLAPPDWWISKFSSYFPCLTSFPLFHLSGHLQKTILCCCKDPSHLNAMNSFIAKLDILSLKMNGGTLGKYRLKKNAK